VGFTASWDRWRELGQDLGSQLIPKPAGFFNPANPEIDALIFDRTGVTCAEIREPFLEEVIDSGADGDSDGMSDLWEENNGLNPIIDDGLDDLDGDGLANRIEYFFDTDPGKSDTDDDLLPDAIEVAFGTDPIAADGHRDPDGDGLTNVEEIEGGTAPLVADPLPRSLPFGALKLWLRPGTTQVVDDEGDFEEWLDVFDGDYSLVPLDGAPEFAGTELNGYPALALASGQNLRTNEGGLLGGPSQDWSLSFVMRSREVSTDRRTALLGNDVWQISGFRLEMDRNALRVSTNQPWDAFDLTTYSVLEVDEIGVVTIVHDGDERETRIYLNGAEQGRASGWIPPNGSSFWVGRVRGVPSHAFDLGELLFFGSALSHLERRSVEAMLLGKYRGEGIGMTDQDEDGMPAWWELSFGGMSLTAGNDLDADGLTNLAESQFTSDPNLPDSDGDTLPDAFELAVATSPWIPGLGASESDADGDGLTLLTELTLGTDPDLADSDGDGIDDGVEVAGNLNPTLQDADLDHDFDGISNADEISAGSAVAEWIDEDTDGMHDRWESLVGLTVGVDDSGEDPDGDNISNLFEFIGGTDPDEQDGDAVPDVERLGAGLVRVVYHASLAADYYYGLTLQRASEVLGWLPVGADLVDREADAATQRVNFSHEPPEGGTGLYRVEARLLEVE
jgi:hypothetical protein